MADDRAETAGKPGISKVKLAVGAASLFLFIVGLKRTFRTDDGAVVRQLRDEEEQDEVPRREGGRATA